MAGLRLLVLLLPIPKPMVLLGAGSSLQLCATLGRFQARRVLVVTDKILVELGLIDPLLKALQEAGVETRVFDDVTPDPSFELVEKGAAYYAEQGCDSVLAVGGGSPIDAAKVIAARATDPRPARKLAGVLKLKTPTAPLYVIPTTAGTGAETTIAAVLTDNEAQRKQPLADPKLVPLAAALDPDLMVGMPPGVTAATGMDALTHAVESFLSRHASPETDRLGLAAVRLIAENLPRAFADGKDLAAREGMAIAAYYAGAAFTKANVGYVHAIAHQFGARYHTPHGLANAIVMPYVLDHSAPAVTDRLAELAVAAGLGAQGDPAAELAERFVAFVRDLNRQLGIPTELEALRAEDISDIARAALKEAHYLYPVPRYMSQRQCEAVVRRMLPAGA